MTEQKLASCFFRGWNPFSSYLWLVFCAIAFAVFVCAIKHFVVDRFGWYFDKEYWGLIEVMTNLLALHYVFAVNSIWQDGRDKKRLVKFAVLEHKTKELSEREKPFIDFMKAAAGKVDMADHFFTGVTAVALNVVMLGLQFQSQALKFFAVGITAFIVSFFLLIIIDSHNINWGCQYRRMGIPPEWIKRLKEINGA